MDHAKEVADKARALDDAQLAVADAVNHNAAELRRIQTLIPQHSLYPEEREAMKDILASLDRWTEASQAFSDALRAAVKEGKEPGILLTHGDSSQCPRVQDGSWPRCLGHRS